jgi:N-acetyl-anhydromuramyl-L-alanine amidase AmpD
MDGLPYNYVHATHDYGVSPVDKQGIVLHVGEGCNNVGYLSGDNVARGVSATFVCQVDGTIVQMLPLNHTHGSIRASDVRRDTDEDGFWGRRWTRYYDPDILTGRVNQRTISVEIDGFASKKWTCSGATYPPGPNEKQVESLIELIERLRSKYSQRLGVNGHRDFADYKPCPGKGTGIKKILSTVGHGPEAEPAPDPTPTCVTERKLIRKLKAKIEVLEDTLTVEASRAKRSYTTLKPYLPKPNEG